MTNPTPDLPAAGAGPAPEDAPADRLWALWRQGERPDLGAFLAQAGDLTPAQLAAVLRVDQRERWRAGEPVPAEAYLRQYPRLREHADGPLDLVYNEFRLRDQAGEAPAPAEYLARFPEHAAALKPLLELHRAMAASSAAAEPAAFRTAPALEAHAADGPGVPGYEVLGELGRGGMGVVYKARQVSLNRVIALKMILAGPHADAEARRRFRAEAEAVARLQHPNIIQVHEHGYSAGHAYLALEYVEGGTRSGKAAGVPQPPAEAARVVETLATAVHYAHGRGFVHRDLKPGNVLVTADGALKITDFGLAKWLHDVPGGDAAAAPTRTGVLVGTPAYMAPEQAAGNRDIGPATDVYALGVILYQLLTGRVPFQGDSALEVLRQVKEDEPLTPSRLRPGLPRDLETVCLKCLRKEPGQRYASAAELAEDLRRFQAGKPIAARPVGTPERVWRWCRRNPALATLTSFLATALLVIAFGSLVVAVRARRAQQEITDKLWESYLRQVQAGRLSQEIGHRLDNLDVLEKAARIRPDLKLRNEAIACLTLTDLRLSREWRTDTPAFYTTVAFDSALTRYAAGDNQGSIRVRRVADDHLLASLPWPADA